MNQSDLLNEFVLLWAVVDPIGTVPVFLAVTQGLSELARRRVALKSVLIAAGVLLFFAVAGESLLKAMELPLASFQIAGGVILFIFALSMIFGSSKPDEEISQIDQRHDAAVFPLAIPSLASPGAILAVVLMTDSNRHSITDQVVSMAVLGLVLLSALALLLCASIIHKLIGRSGAIVASRIMGLMLAAVATDHVITGIFSHISRMG